MGQIARTKERVRDYRNEAETQYHFPPDTLHGEGGTVNPEILNRVYQELKLNYWAQCGICKFMQSSLFQGQAAKIWFINESLTPPPEEPRRKRSPWLHEQWRRHGNIWLLHLIEKIGVHKPSRKAIVANVAVIVRIAGGSSRVALMEVDDYLSNRGSRMSQSELRELVRNELFDNAKELTFAHNK